MSRLEGGVVLVTGGGGGLGEAICYALGAAGALVVAADVRKEAAERTAENLEAAGGKALGIALDVADERSAARVVDAALELLDGPRVG